MPADRIHLCDAEANVFQLRMQTVTFLRRTGHMPLEMHFTYDPLRFCGHTRRLRCRYGCATYTCLFKHRMYTSTAGTSMCEQNNADET